MVKALYRLLRVPNLLMIALTQYLVLYCIIKPNVTLGDGMHFINNLNFALLVVSTVFIAMGGYIINDYFDMRADRINKPDKMVIGVKISRSSAMILYWIFNVTGVLLGAYVAYKLNGWKTWKLGILNLIVFGTLFYYSTNFKRQLLIGNFVISFLTAFVLLTVWLFEYYSVNTNTDTLIDMINVFTTVIMPYFIFAFLISFARELIKDIEDMEGDIKIGCNTVPIKYGKKKTRNLALIILIFILLLLVYATYRINSWGHWLLFWYMIIAIDLPLLYIILKIIKSETKEQFSSLSVILKIIMLAGILSMEVFYL